MVSQGIREENNTFLAPTRTYDRTSCLTGLAANASFNMNFITRPSCQWYLSH